MLFQASTKTREFLERASEVFLDTIFPKHCLGCDIEGAFICALCVKNLKRRVDTERCPACGKEAYLTGKYANGTLCASCRKSLGLDGIIWSFDYRGKLAPRVIQAVKYYGIKELIEPLTAILYDSYLSIPFALRPEEIADKTDFVKLIPIPLHKRRSRARGFNQAELIAEELSRLSSWKLEKNILKRARYTETQTELGREERILNMEGAFELLSPPDKEATYILIDDIITTGATIGSAAKLLKKNGAKVVWGMAFAKG